MDKLHHTRHITVNLTYRPQLVPGQLIINVIYVTDKLPHNVSSGSESVVGETLKWLKR
jgi:hypothetical protein